MTISYKMIQRVEPGEKGGGKRASYPSIKINKTIGPDDFIELLYKQFHIPKVDAFRVMIAMSEVLKEQILNGNILQFKDLGSFYPRLRYHGEPDVKQIKQDDLELGIGFRPLLHLKKELSVAKFIKVKD